MANRLILTLLALLTGLAAQIGPAEARASGIADVAVVLAMPAAKAPRAPAALAQLPEPGLRNARAFAPAAVMLPITWQAPAVLTGIDRARE